MSRETCVKCEQMFAETILRSDSIDMDTFLDWSLDSIEIDRNICLKCLARIVSRYDN